MLMENRAHSVVMEDRRKIAVSAVNEVCEFDEAGVVMRVDGAMLTIKGKGLHVDALSVESGEAEVTGERIDSVTYTKHEREKHEG